MQQEKTVLVSDEEKLREIAENKGKHIVTDSRFGRVVHIDKFECITSDGVHIYEWP